MKWVFVVMMTIGGHMMSENALGASFTISVSKLSPGETIPTRYTCDGEDTSPPISWSGAPLDTQSFVLVVDDPDAPMGTWIHWLLYDIPASVTTIAEGEKTPPGKAGKNSWPHDNQRYRGPCPPPPTGVHRYYFRLYALDTMLRLPEGQTLSQVEAAMKPHILAKTEWMGKYKR